MFSLRMGFPTSFHDANMSKSTVGPPIVTNRVKAPNLAHLFLLTYQTNLEGVPCDSTFRGDKKLIAITQYPYTYMKARVRF